ncbi:MAG: dTDP-4-dehydrorhamnose 3,5-epimerase [Chloroflexi bacterium]|nr:dTDP-4-dehydrorhamnose 3,5-epimerase [Chloroflexota bacterium]
MIFYNTDIPDLIIIEPRVFADARGFFMETYQQEKFNEAGISQQFVQDNHSRSAQGTLRGLHYQIKHPQGKLVRAILGEVFDVAVDLRRSSLTFGKWFGCVLSAENKRQIWIPVGFAHGFYTLSDWAEILYKTTDYYSPEHERSILWNDSEIGINWPKEINNRLILSPKDTQGSTLATAEVFS